MTTSHTIHLDDAGHTATLTTDHAREAFYLEVSLEALAANAVGSLADALRPHGLVDDETAEIEFTESGVRITLVEA